MPIVRLQKWIRFDRQRRTEIEAYRAALLDGTFRPFAVIGAIAMTLGSWRALRDGQWSYAAVYLSMYVGGIIFAVTYKRLSVRTRANVLLTAMFAMSAAVLLRVGLGGVGVLLLVTSCGLTGALRGVRASLLAVAISVLAMGVVGYAMVTGLLTLPPDRMHTSIVASAWVTAAIVFVAASAGLVIPFQMLSVRLGESLDSLEVQAKELEHSNNKLREEVRRRQGAEEVARANERRYRHIFDATSVPIWVGDVSGVRTAISELAEQGVDDIRAHLDDHPELVWAAVKAVEVLDVNQATLETYKAESKEQLLKSLQRVFDPDSLPAFREMLVAMAEGSNVFEGEGVHHTLQGDQVQVMLRLAIPSEPDHALLTTVDITERKQLEQSLANAQKMEAIGTLAGGIAHDFNNLLMGIQGFVSIMLVEGVASDPVREHLEDINKLVQSGATLTGQLLGFARRGKYDVKPTDLRALLERTISIFGRTKKEIRTHLQLPEDLRTVEVDQTQIEQVLLNLYVNSWQAMPAGGELTVAAENVTLDDEAAEQRGLLAGDHVRISIRDTGRGMDADTQRRVFEPFFTTKPRGRGTGLGLASVYGIIENHGGVIELSSEVGKGTTFCITLPATDAQLPREELKPVGQPSGKETILVIDDEPAVLQVTTLMLTNLGYCVLTASSGPEALRILEFHRGIVGAVILDMVMPKMSGPEVFAELRVVAPNAPVLLSSGYSQDQKAEAVLKQGAAGFIQKPFGLAALANKLRKVLDEK